MAVAAPRSSKALSGPAAPIFRPVGPQRGWSRAGKVRAAGHLRLDGVKSQREAQQLKIEANSSGR